VLVLDMASAPDAPPLYGQPDAQGLLPWPGHAAARERGASVHANPQSDTHALSADSLIYERVDGHNIVVARPRNGMFPTSWQQTRELFDALRAAHDYIVLHAPPASQSFDGVENAALADATILAVRAESTRKPVALGLKTQVQDAGGRLVGLALTHRRGYIPDFIYRFF
jgi:Mrp family chromosome partitioning ATPase